MAYTYNALNATFTEYGIPVGHDVIEPYDDAKQSIKKLLCFNGEPPTSEGVKKQAEALASAIRVDIAARIPNFPDYEVGGYKGQVLIGVVPSVPSNAHGENPLLMGALAKELRKQQLCPVYAVFGNDDGKAGEFFGFFGAAD